MTSYSLNVTWYRTLVSSDGSTRILFILSSKSPRWKATSIGTLCPAWGSIKPPVAIWASRSLKMSHNFWVINHPSYLRPRDSTTKPRCMAVKRDNFSFSVTVTNPLHARSARLMVSIWYSSKRPISNASIAECLWVVLGSMIPPVAALTFVLIWVILMSHIPELRVIPNQFLLSGDHSWLLQQWSKHNPHLECRRLRLRLFLRTTICASHLRFLDMRCYHWSAPQPMHMLRNYYVMMT